MSWRLVCQPARRASTLRHRWGWHLQGTLADPAADLAVYLSSKICHNCGTTNTPLWRKYQGLDMCNACGVSPHTARDGLASASNMYPAGLHAAMTMESWGPCSGTQRLCMCAVCSFCAVA